MAKSASRRIWEVYDGYFPAGVRRRVDGAVKTCAKATQSLRNREQIHRRGEASVKAVRRRLRV